MVDATAKNTKRRHQHLKSEAIRWLIGNSDDFREVCQRPGLDADTVRIRAKKAFCNPGAWRTEAGMSERYAERKALHARKRAQRSKAECARTALPPVILVGPWKLEVADVE